jgi:hypothetical protein
MPTSPYVSWFSETSEQGLYDDLIVEQIKLYGYDIYYLPRVAVRLDTLLGEDILSRYPHAIPIEAYIDNVEGFQGEGDLFSKFGMIIRDRITFTIARTRWEEVANTHVQTETGYNLTLEDADTARAGALPSLLSEQDAAWTLGERPHEDDLVFFPLVNKIFEIKFVEHEQLFYQFGRRSIYKLQCELYEASSERIDTGIPAIDAIEDRTTLDILGYEMLLETGDRLLNETGGSFILESQRPETVEPSADNELIQTNVPNVADFSEWNPLSLTRQY